MAEIISGYQNQIKLDGKYYVYRYIRHDKAEPFYIGIGTKNKDDLKYGTYTRANNKHTINKTFCNIVESTTFDIEILLESDDYDFIKEKEKEFIKLYGRLNKNTGTLVNMTAGGQGVVGMVFTEETLKKFSARKGRRLSPESQAKRIATLKEKYRLNPPIRTKEQKEKLRLYRLGKKETEQTKINRKATYARKNEEFEKGNLDIKLGNTRKVVNKETGKIFPSISAAARTINMKSSTLHAKVSGIYKNNTPFVYLEDYKS